MAQVSLIPAKKALYSELPLTGAVRRRVAGYARVSTDLDEQVNSYEAQVDYYTQHIKSKSDWDFVSVYTDEGISATSTTHRDGFNKMITDALAGKIDLIITKSVSRFARNTVDTLTTIRKLKENGVECYFEKENIYTFDSKGELMLTIMSSIAQEESRSISENVKWGWRKRMADGKVTMPYSSFLGYEKGEDGKPQIVESEAEVVRQIYRLFLDGCSVNSIAQHLTKQGIPTPAGKRVWQAKVVESILTNEKMKGCCLSQKVYKPDLLLKPRKNDGVIDQFYVKDSHPGIVSSEVFDEVQEQMQRRKLNPSYTKGWHPFAGRIICGQCGHAYTRKVWHSTDQYRKYIWRCGAKYEKGTRCATPHVSEELIKDLFVQAVNWVIGYKDEIAASCDEIKAILLDVVDLDAECATVHEKMEKCYAERKKLIERNNRSPEIGFANQDTLHAEQHEALKKQYKKLRDERKRRVLSAGRIDSFCEDLIAQGGSITEFDEGLWLSLVEKATVYTREDIRFTFRDGTVVGGMTGCTKSGVSSKLMNGSEVLRGAEKS
jgi:DNA invertase Pin-like site-specific DNA recombinase